MGAPEASGDASRVIVVDDDAVHLRTVAGHLESQHYDVRTFASAAQALSHLDACGDVHVLLAELYMPETSGIDLVRALGERYPAVTPILMAARTDVATAALSIRHGAYDYLVKPIEPDALLLAVRRAVERARLFRQNLHVQRKLEVALARLAAHEPDAHELEDAIERAIALARGEDSTRHGPPPALSGPKLEPLSEARSRFERGYVEEALRRAGGNLSAAARIAGIDRSNFRRLLRRLNQDAPASSRPPATVVGDRER
jgi:DNA-binding NtrC family response regulator